MSHPWSAAALRYAANGWPVFILGRNKSPVANCGACQPVRPGGPPPHDPQACQCLTCHGFYAATRDPRTIGRMLAAEPAGLLAIRTGAPSGLVVADIDPDKGGWASFTDLARRGYLPRTRHVRTGADGLHLYYAHPGAHVKIPSSHSKLAPGVDIKADGGYVVAPPSPHPRTRRPYAWADQTQPIEEMAAPLAAWTRTPPPPTAVGAAAISHPDLLMNALLDKVRNAPPGKRRSTLYGCARGAARITATGAITASQAQAALLAVGLAVGQTERSALAAITGGFRDEGVPL